MFRTIVAKYAGSTCKRCGSKITIGEQIRYGGPGQIYHLASACPKGTGYTDDPPYAHLGNYTDPDLTEPPPAAETPTVRPHRFSNAYRRQRGSTYTRFSSGAEQYTNRNGRCEDAPCCGCCS